MAKRRMFSPSIVESDVFLDMPLTSQALYFHLGMNADDDGFVNPRRIMRMIGASDDDLKILISKRYILWFESGIVVVKHWPINNLIRGDRYGETTYKLEKSQLTKNEFGAYTEITNITTKVQEYTGVVNQPPPIGKPNDIPTVNPGKVSIGKVSIGKVSIGKVSTNTTNVVLAEASAKKTASKDIDELFAYWHEKIGYEITSKVRANRFACSNLLKKHGGKKTKQLIDGVALAAQDKYAPAICDFCDLQSKLSALLLWGHKRNNNQEVVVI